MGDEEVRLVRLMYQYHPMGRIYITFCEKQGNLPIYMENRSTSDEKGMGPKSSNDESDYRKILSASTTEWRKHRDVWYPIRVKLESIQSKNKLKPVSDRELSLYWYFDEKMTPKSLEEMLPAELCDLFLDNAQIKP